MLSWDMILCQMLIHRALDFLKMGKVQKYRLSKIDWWSAMKSMQLSMQMCLILLHVLEP